VLDDYRRNVTLVDLSAQPDEIKSILAECISTNSVAKKKPMVGAQFLKFCGKFDLVKASEQAEAYASWLGASYNVK
jgi:hypothetical protein